MMRRFTAVAIVLLSAGVCLAQVETASFLAQELKLRPRFQVFTTADMNADGADDIVTGGPGRVIVFQGTLAGGFAAPVKYRGGANPKQILVRDISGDGILDVVFSRGASVVRLLGAGLGGFPDRQSKLVDGSTSGLVIGDFNADGNADCAVGHLHAHWSSNSLRFDNFIHVIFGTAGGVLGDRRNTGAGHFVLAISSGDFNGDGLDDVAAVNHAVDSVSLFPGQAGLGLGERTEFPACAGARECAAADFNGDTVTDLAVIGNLSISVLLGGPAGLGGRSDYDLISVPARIVTGDFNGDTRADIAVLLREGVKVLYGDGAGGFPSESLHPVSFPDRHWRYWFMYLGAGDYNGDARTDIVVNGTGRGRGFTTLLTNTGNLP